MERERRWLFGTEPDCDSPPACGNCPRCQRTGSEARKLRSPFRPGFGKCPPGDTQPIRAVISQRSEASFLPAFTASAGFRRSVLLRGGADRLLSQAHCQHHTLKPADGVLHAVKISAENR